MTNIIQSCIEYVEYAMTNFLCEHIQHMEINEMSTAQELITMCVEQYPEIDIDPNTLISIFNTNNKHFPCNFDPEKAFGVAQTWEVKKGDKIAIIADLHGSMSDFLEFIRELQDKGFLDHRYRCAEGFHVLVLGDFMDRGRYGLLIGAILAALRMENPEQFHVIKGNHEDLEINKSYSFLDREFQSFLKNEKAIQVLENFYKSLPLTLYFTQNGKAVQGTHGLFPLTFDVKEFIEKGESGAEMVVPKERKLSERMQKMGVDFETDYEGLLKQTLDTEKRKQLQLLKAAKRIIELVSSDESKNEDSEFQWADIGAYTYLESLKNRRYRYSNSDIAEYQRINDIVTLFKGHAHEFDERIVDNKVVTTTLTVGMDSIYGNSFVQPHISCLLTVGSDISEWTKQFLQRWSGSSYSSWSKSIPMSSSFKQTQLKEVKKEMDSLITSSSMSYTVAAEYLFLHARTEIDISLEETQKLGDKNPRDLMVALLDQFLGLYLAKREGDLTEKFITDNMQYLQKAGVRTLYVEKLVYDTMQKSLDCYFENSMSNSLPSDLEEYFKKINMSAYSKLLQAAYLYKIRVVGIDTTMTYKSDYSTETKADVICRNSVASAIIDREEQNSSGKYIIVSDVSRLKFSKKNVFGFGQLFGVPTLEIGNEEYRIDWRSFAIINLNKNE